VETETRLSADVAAASARGKGVACRRAKKER
jgi:hypothetical protein